MSTPTLALWGPPLLYAPEAAPVALRFERRGQLLGLLALEPGRWWTREQLATLFWPTHEAAQARRNLRKVVFLAHELVGDALQASEHALRWVGGSDLADFAAAPQLSLRRGLLLEGFDDAAQPGWMDWLQQERLRWQTQWQAAASRQLGEALRLGNAGAAEPLALQMLALDPLDEAAVEALMRTQLAAGQPARAEGTLRLYAQRLRDGLGLEPSGQLRALLQARPAAETARAAPAPDDDFIGRRTELRLLDELFAREGCRWLTLLGPGGVGKSRLARRWQQQHAGSGMWVDLQDIGDAAQVPARLAQALGVAPGTPQAPLAPLLLSLQTLDAPVWVLDNAEQVQGLGPLLAELLAGAPTLRLLLTSRVRLHEPPSEWLLPLEGLAQPDEDSRDPEAALSFDAVRLFVRRARAARPEVDVLSQLPHILELIDSLGGLPLAIELAAS